MLGVADAAEKGTGLGVVAQFKDTVIDQVAPGGGKVGELDLEDATPGCVMLGKDPPVLLRDLQSAKQAFAVAVETEFLASFEPRRGKGVEGVPLGGIQGGVVRIRGKLVGLTFRGVKENSGRQVRVGAVVPFHSVVRVDVRDSGGHHDTVEERGGTVGSGRAFRVGEDDVTEGVGVGGLCRRSEYRESKPTVIQEFREV